MSEKDQLFMQRAIQIALLGEGTVSPNPMVGCVITVLDKVIGEGWHQKAGEGHAEVRAVNAVQKKELLKEATVYVTLEPCAHHGKTPPCAELLVAHKVKRVVIGCKDPNPLVAGKGVKILEDAGIEVNINCLEEQCSALNKIFFHGIEKQQPYIYLKWAQTADGYVARENFDSKWISNSMSRQLVHKWRSQIDAILVGKNTAKYDDPSLNVREWTGNNPLRVVIDHHCELSEGLNVFRQKTPTIIYNVERNEIKGHLEWVKLDNVKFIELMLSDLYQRKMTSLFVEGGTSTLQQFIDLGSWNEASIFQSNQVFDKGVKAPKIHNYKHINTFAMEDNYLIHYTNR